MGKTEIDWKNEQEGWQLDSTYSPVIGCQHGCHLCIAEQWNKRFKWIKDWRKPEWKQNIYKKNLPKKPSTIFVVFLGDLFGEWVSFDWIRKIIRVTYVNPEHRFLFLTKNPMRYSNFLFGENCWLGTSVSTKKDMHRIDVLQQLHYKRKMKTFVSVEPITGSFKDCYFGDIDWVIVGAMSGPPGVVKPTKEWVKSVKHDNIYYKNNVRGYL